MIVAEGADGSGKTTLLERIAERTGRQIIHVGGPPESLDDIIQRMGHQIMNPDALHDRTPLISELVYSDESLLTPDAVDYWAAIYRGAGVVVVYCRPPNEIILETVAAASVAGKPYKSTEHLDAVKQRIETIVSNYDRVIQNMVFRGITVLGYNRENKSRDSFIETILNWERVKHGKRNPRL